MRWAGHTISRSVVTCNALRYFSSGTFLHFTTTIVTEIKKILRESSTNIYLPLKLIKCHGDPF